MAGSERTRPFDVAFCDTCIGGSTVAANLAAHVSGLSAFFLADYTVNPLGTKDGGDIRAALERWANIAAERAPVMIVACNTASAELEASPATREHVHQLGLEVYSMVDLLDRLLDRVDVRSMRVCLMGTEYTVNRPVYAERIERAGASEVVRLGATRTESAVANLQHTIETGRAIIREEIGERIRDIDAVVLACTCFPLVGDLITELNPDARQLDPGPEISSLTDWPERAGPNVLTLAHTGDAARGIQLQARAADLFPGWDRVEVVSLGA